MRNNLIRDVYFFSMLLLGSLWSVAQTKEDNRKMDSLRQVISQMPEDTTKWKALRQLYNEYRDFDYTEAEKVALEELQLAKKIGFKLGEATACRHLGNTYSVTGRLSKAITFHISALHLYESFNATFFVAACYNNIGEVYRVLHAWDRAEANFRKAIQIWKPLESGREGVAIAMEGLGDIYLAKQKTKVAESFYKKSLELGEDIQANDIICNALVGLANSALQQNQLQVATSYLEQSSPLAEQLRNNDVLTEIYFALSEIAFRKGLSVVASKHALRSLALATQTDSKENLSKCYYQLARIYKRLQDDRTVAHFQSLYIELSDSLLRTTSALEVSEIQHDYELKKKELENAALVKERTAMRQLYTIRRNVVVISIAIVLSLLFFFLHREVRRQKKLSAFLIKQKKLIQDQSEEIAAQNEEIMEQNNKMAAQNETLSGINLALNRIFILISHDLRSPFKTMEGMLSLIHKGQLKPDEIVTLSAKLSDSLAMTSSLLDNLLLWSKTQLKGTKANKEVFDLQKLVTSVLPFYKPLAAHKRIEIAYEKPVSHRVYADYNMVASIVRNLLNNAIKFSGFNGSVTIETSNVGVDVLVAVRDSGTGMKSEVQEKIFDVANFYSTPGTNQEKGTGLGLKLCREFVLLNGGKIWVESEVGKGSAFMFTLPATAHQIVQEEDVETK